MKKYLLLSIVSTMFLAFFVSSSYATTFSDIGDTHRAKDEIYYLAEGKIVTGDLSGAFKPDREVTRAEAAAMIGRSLSFDATKISTGFKDVSANHFASGYIDTAVKQKIITGYKDGTFRPDKPVTRGEMAILLSRAFKYDAATIASASQALVLRGIAQGLPDGSFGEGLSIKRSDFAVFLARSVDAKQRASQDLLFPSKSIVNAEPLNIRSGPSTNYTVVGKLTMNQEVDVAYQIGNWSYIQYNDQRGFVHNSFLVSSAENPENPEDPGEQPPVDPNPVDIKTIIIDPGHGGKDPGAIGLEKLFESNVVLDTSIRLKNYFNQAPFQVVLTREIDETKTLAERVEFANNNNGNIFVSIHANAFNSKANGTETYYFAASTNPFEEESKALATYIQKRLITAWNLVNRGVKNGNFYVIRENTMPSVLVELGFIDYKADHEKLKSPEWREEAAKAIYLGILDYYYHIEKLDVVEHYNLVNATPSNP